jgi:hypothetical protein
MEDYPLLHKPDLITQDPNKERQLEIDKIKKNYDNLILYATKNPTFDTINALFSTHPFYKNLTIEKKGNHIVCNYSILSIKTNEWKNYIASAFGEENRDKLYINISEKIKMLTVENKEIDNDNKIDFF